MKRNLLLRAWSFLLFMAIGTTSVFGQCKAEFVFETDSNNHKKIMFQNTSVYSGNITSFEWKFGDAGGDSTNLYPEFNFPDDGEYEVCFRFETDSGCIDTICQMIHVGQQPNCHSGFEFQFSSADPMEVNFMDQSNSPQGIASWYWTFGDGSDAVAANPIHKFQVPGDYQVCLEITSHDSCVQNFCTNVHVADGQNNQPCKAEFHTEPDSTDHLKMKFVSNAHADTNIVKHEWAVNQQMVGSGVEFNHNFLQEGTYEVCHMIESESGCRDTNCFQVTVGQQGGDCYPSFDFFFGNGNEVSFADSSWSSAGVTEWHWDFGDTQTSTEQNPVHNYAQEGEYNVCLTIKSADSCEKNYCTMIQVGQQQGGCMADFNDFSGQGLEHGFEDRSQAPNGISTFTWDMGDGNSYTTSNINHVYQNPGSYNVCLMIAGDQCADTLCRQINVDDNQGGGDCQPNYSFVHDTNNVKVFSFKDETQLSDGSVTSWEWDFGDGNKVFTQNPTHTYVDDGMYTVCLKITTDKGCEEMHCDFVSIGQVGCHAEFGWDHTGAEQELKFQNHSFSDTTITAYSWNIDGVTYSEENPTHAFADTGLFTVELIIANVTGCSDTVVKEVHVGGGNTNQNGCQAGFGWDMNNPDGSSYNFNDNSFADSGIKTWEFSMGDGLSYTSSNFTHAYTANGDYNVCLAIEANDGCRDTICNMVNVHIDTTNHNGGEGKDSLVVIQGCLATIWAEQNAADPKGFQFSSGSASATGANLSHLWEIDGQQFTTEEVQYLFTSAGEKDVKLTVSGDGCTNSAVLKVKAGDNTSCGVSFTFVVDTMNENRAQFALSGTNNLTGGFWQFGDGMQADEKDPIHHFPGPGFYDVCINAYDSASGCQTQFCQPIEIKGAQQGGNCFAQFDFQIDEQTVAFVNNSQGNYTNIHYKFGDGGFSEEANPTHTYTASGVYEVCLNVFDSVSGCVADFCMPITVLADSNDVYCHADFDFFPIGERKFTFANHSQGNFTEVKWKFNGGANVVKDFEAEFEFPGPGHHEVCLSIFDSISGCFNSVCKFVEIVDTTVVNCRADFDFFKEQDGQVVFNSRATGTYTNVHFTLGDGMISDNDQFSHVYTNPGHYDVCMAVYDSVSGCQDQFCKKVAVAPDTATVFCEAKMDGYLDDNGVAHASNLSTGAYTNVHWDFGDGFHSNENNPSHEFAKSGFYMICLNIFDSISGCHANICDEVNIQLDSADVICAADFNYMVIGDKVSFENISVGDVSNAHWRFGDWTFSDDLNPTHIYPQTGVYPVCLDVWDSASGCQANICKEITIVKDTADVFCEAKFDYIQLANGEIQFQNASVGDYSHVHWDLGNGIFADHNDPIGHYPNGGVYPVSIMIWDSVSGCQASFKEEIAVAGNTNQVECHAKFEFFPVNDSLVQFKSAAQGAYTNIHWEFGDGTFAEGEDAVEHVFPHGGFFNVCVGIFDSISGCHDFACDNVELLLDTTIVDCHAEFEFFPTSVTEVAFNNVSAGQFTNSFWKFSDGTVDYSANPVIDFNGTGLFGACLTVYDSVSGCQDEFCVEVPIIDDTTVYCDAHFGYFVDGRTVKFEPEIKGDITGWVWDYNDGFSSNDSFPSHTFEKDGVFDVCLTVFDSTSGCFNTYCDQISILTDVDQVDEYVLADFSYFLDPNDGKVHFKDESVGNPDTWYWDFGDGDSAGVSQNPTYEYTEDGYYEVCLTVKNPNGGQETKCNVIAVGDVTDACFAKFDYYANAVTATAHFDNKALGRINSYEWDFGDSLTSIQYQPSHTYADTGFYPVCLTVTNDSGCVRTFCNEIRVGNALENKCLIGCVWPGDANLDLEANHYDILPIGLHYGETGPARDEVSDDWRGHESQDWSKQLWGDVNNKHGDANGDGVIDITDIEIVEQNFAYSHAWQPRSNAQNQLSIDWDVDDIDVGETAVLTVSIPDSVNVTMYGLGFEIDLDPYVFDYSTIQYDFSNSFLGTENSDLITFGFEDENLGEIYIAESRNDHEELTGNGELVRILVTAKANSSNTGAVLTTEGGVTAEGDTVEFSGAEDGANINSIEERGGYLVKDLVVFPNPTKGNVTFNLPVGTTTDYVIDVYDNVGSLVYTTTQSGGGIVNQSLEQYNSGIYTIQVTNDKVKYMQKVIVTK